ncbi:MAG: hypothetical protein WBM07_18175, partial [Chitinivibrionales bacterium]
MNRMSDFILPGHPKWDQFFNCFTWVFKNESIWKHSDAKNGLAIPYKIEGNKVIIGVMGFHEAYHPALIYALKNVGLTDEEIIINLINYQRYGAFGDTEFHFNFHKYFSGSIRREQKDRKIHFRFIPWCGLGDLVIATGIIREIHANFPQIRISVESLYPELFNFPFLEKPDLENSTTEVHTNNGYPLTFEPDLKTTYVNKLHMSMQIKTGLKWELSKSKGEINIGNTLNPVRTKLHYYGHYWLINSGWHTICKTKYYPYYQQVVDLLKDKITFIQYGRNFKWDCNVENECNEPLRGVLSMVDQTDNILELAAAFHDCDGSLGGGSANHLHFAKAFNKKAVGIFGGNERDTIFGYSEHSNLFSDSFECEKSIWGNHSFYWPGCKVQLA